ncbi:hypothetical protein BDY21DRAFT_359304 [Lineolata rhizophorae]|uniref:Uncharacterized protein n=1 Tax=Lineolata rhizophorae TaxID=578093 RepID=A0A6A6NKX9_9PEZI|nr:hypothetical protein BDY21DRAFT_359304 [Lineolata rhizophorae]
MESGQLSSTAELEPEDSSGQQPSTEPKNITQCSKRAASSQFCKWGVRGDVTHLQHGMLDGKPASLIGFDFRLLDGGDGNRFSQVKVVLSFYSEPGGEASGKACETAKWPEVKVFAPKLLHGPATRTKHINAAGVSASLAGPVHFIHPQLELFKSKHVEYVRDYRLEVKGTRWSSDKRMEHDNMVVWEVRENSRQGDGVPKELRFAVLVQHEARPFVGTVKMQVTTKWGLRLFGWPWTRPHPLLFQPSAAVGVPIDVGSFGELADGHWKGLADFYGPLESCRWTEKSKLERQT